MIARLIRRWLGVPTRAEVRGMVLREIDADAAWRDAPKSGRTFGSEGVIRSRDRSVAIILGEREDTRA